MGKKTGIFTEGQHVFAKVKGYSPWPAKITRAMGKYRYSVYFYGTGETASVKSEDLDPYDERNRTRFNTERQLKKNDYREAVEQIASALSGNDPAPLITEDTNANSNNNNTQNEFDTSQVVDEDDSQLHIDEGEVPQSAPKSSAKKQASKLLVTIKPEKVATPAIIEIKTSDEKISRSGRKIKEKKMSADEMDIDEALSQPIPKRAKLDEIRMKPILSPADSTSTAMEEFRQNKMYLLLDPIKKSFLQTQYDMIQHVQDIKMNLGLEKANIEESLILLENLKTNVLPNITKLMLLKYPNIVDTLKRLRKYIGNMNSWEMDEASMENFKERSGKIREEANDIYARFRTMFQITDGNSFWQAFGDMEQDFKRKTVNVGTTDLFEAETMEELELLANKNDDAEVPNVPLSPEMPQQPEQIEEEESAEPVTDGVDGEKTAEPESL